MSAESSWKDAYQGLVATLDSYVTRSRLLIGGFSTCLDMYLSLRDAEGVRQAATDTPAEKIFAELNRRATLGVGGELAFDWPAGPGWMNAHLPGRPALGGTSAQAAQQLALLGAEALIALSDRSKDQLDVIHPKVLVASAKGAVASDRIPRQGELSKPPHYIFEFAAGETIGGAPVPRSSRVILRFSDAQLEHDPDFERLSVTLASRAGAGIVCGLNEVSSASLEAEAGYAASLAHAWRERGLSLVHFELGDYEEPYLRDRSLAKVAPAVSSLGMSLSEFHSFCPAGEAQIETRVIQLAERFGLSRVCVHADEWAMAATLGDAEREREALMMGCLLAASRASAGQAVFPKRLPDNARFSTPPLSNLQRRNDWSIVSCPAPYLTRPVATIGLGDTFLAGTLLVLGGAQADLPSASSKDGERRGPGGAEGI